MNAKVEGQLVIDAASLGDRHRAGIVTNVARPDGTPRYPGRWPADDHESRLYPGPAARAGSPEPAGSAL